MKSPRNLRIAAWIKVLFTCVRDIRLFDLIVVINIQARVSRCLDIRARYDQTTLFDLLMQTIRIETASGCCSNWQQRFALY